MIARQLSADSTHSSVAQGVIVVMGVSGCGKSTVARILADKLGAAFCEADDLHPTENIRKMASGVPLNDKDRLPWLEQVQQVAHQQAKSHGCVVVACSALKQHYRDILEQAHSLVTFVYMQGDYQTILNRMSNRTEHFMPDSLLQSQFDALEEPTDPVTVFTVSITHSPMEIARQSLPLLRKRHTTGT